MVRTTVAASEQVKHHKYLLALGMLFAILWAVLAVNPWHRDDWLLENVLVLGCVLFVALTFTRLNLSRTSYTLLFVFLCLHEIGAHYTYSEVPYDEWFKSVSGMTLNSVMGWERNKFDRVIHFSYGLLLAYPVREILLRLEVVRGFWAYFLPFDLTMSSSALYELFEWAAAEFVGGDLGQAYLGTQGDVWDAHKDIALASMGALAAMLITFAINRALSSKMAPSPSLD